MEIVFLNLVWYLLSLVSLDFPICHKKISDTTSFLTCAVIFSVQKVLKYMLAMQYLRLIRIIMVSQHIQTFGTPRVVAYDII